MLPFKGVALGGGLCLFSRWEADHFILVSLNNNWDPEAWSIEVAPGYNTTDWSLRGPIHICKRRHSYASSFTRSIDKLPFETIHKSNLLCSIHTAEHVLNIYIMVLIWRPSDYVQVIQQTKLQFYHYLTYPHVALNFVYSVEHRTYYNKCLCFFVNTTKVNGVQVISDPINDHCLNRNSWNICFSLLHRSHVSHRCLKQHVGEKMMTISI